MMYAVYSMRKHQQQGREDWAEWFILGVWQADDPEAACRAAAKKNQGFGNFFAVEGTPWGVDLDEVDATEFGIESPEDLARKVDEAIRDSDSRLAQLEAQSRKMEREAGIA